jgi:hypothetical protein
MSAELLAMPGVTKPDAPALVQPCADVIDDLERMLAEAKRGEIQAFGAAIVRHNGRTAFTFSGANHTGHDLAAATLDLVFEIGAMRAGWRAPYGSDVNDPA